MTWVDDRHAKQQKIQRESPEAWDRLREVMRQSTDSFRTRFAEEEKLDLKVAQPLRQFSISISGPNRPYETAVFSLDTSNCAICRENVPVPGSRTRQTELEVLKIDVDDGDTISWVFDGKRVNDEQASEILLKPILFPND